MRARILGALGDGLQRAVPDTERVCLEAAERMLSRLFADGTGSRSEAVDLLAADALVTYALEFAAETPPEFEARATQALQRFGQLEQGRA